MSPTRAKKPTGPVALVGAGPGDPGLLVQRAAELLAGADLVLAHEGVADAVVALVGEATEVVRTPAGEPQAAAATAAAKEGRAVVRLLPGDPYSTPEGLKEADALAKAKLRLEVVPGVPLDVAVPAYAGVPAGAPRTVVRLEDGVDWRALAAAPGALVLLCRAGEAVKAATSLVEHGRKASEAVAVTAAATTTEQRTATATLDTAEQATSGLSPDAEVVVVVGDGAKKADRLGWWEARPLFGWKVLVPRTRDQAGSLSALLRAHGAVPVEVPTIAVEPPRTSAPMDRAVKGIGDGRYQWVAFTSVNAVRAIREKLDEMGLDARIFSGVKVAAVGEATAQALVDFGLRPDLVPSGQQSSEGLLAEWPPYDDAYDLIDRVFLPRADIATDTLLAGLKDLGWQVDDVTAYRTVRAAPPPVETREALKGGGFDAVLFTSSSTVRNLVGIAGKPHDTTVLACIGPATKATAEELGLRVDVLAPKPDVAVLVEALAEHALARREQDLAPPSAARKKKAVKK